MRLFEGGAYLMILCLGWELIRGRCLFDGGAYSRGLLNRAIAVLFICLVHVCLFCEVPLQGLTTKIQIYIDSLIVEVILSTIIHQVSAIGLSNADKEELRVLDISNC